MLLVSMRAKCRQKEKTMTHSMTVVGGVLLAFVLATGASAATDAPQSFEKKAGAAGLYELRAAELARDKARDEDVREFADEMLKDHQKADQELRSLAKKRSWTVPAALEPKHQQMIDRLGKLEGADFEREYAQQQLQAHEEAVALFKEQSERGSDPELKAWATEKVPTLQEHLEHAEDLGDAATGTGRSLDRSTPSESMPRGSSVPDGGMP
jgi:putative membrane protein